MPNTRTYTDDTRVYTQKENDKKGGRGNREKKMRGTKTEWEEDL